MEITQNIEVLCAVRKNYNMFNKYKNWIIMKKMNLFWFLLGFLTLSLQANPAFADSDCANIDFEYAIDGKQVEFKASADQDVTKWHWDFGDGNRSDTNPARNQYEKAGSYTVCLKALVAGSSSNTECIVRICKTINIETNSDNDNDCGLEANFEYEIDGTVVHFRAKANQNAVGFAWSFGANTALSQANTSHDFGVPGVYEVCLTAFVPGTDCRVRICKKIEITADNDCGLEADFGFTIEGTVVHFEAKSNIEGSVFLWSFSSLANMNQQQISHDFKEPGVYEVCLTVFVPNTSCRLKICKRIVIPEDENDCGLKVDFDFKIEGTMVHFSARSTVTPVVLIWSFLPATSMGNQQDVSHDFGEPGIYEVCLLAYVPETDCKVRICKTIEIKDDNDCEIEADFEIFQFGSTLRFVARVNILDAQFSWSFGDGNTAEGRIVGHTYSDDGVFKVCLTVTNEDKSCRTLICKEIKISPQEDECDIRIDFREIIMRNQVQFFARVNTPVLTNAALRFYWDFGDGTTAEGAQTKHEYKQPGIYTVCLTVVDPSVSCKKQICKRIVIGRDDFEVGNFNENEGVFDFRFYPNPALDFIQLDATSPVLKYELWDMSHTNLLHSASATGQSMRINLFNIPSGIHVLRVFSEDNQVVAKRIKVQ
jgi:PKD repeat protein